MRNLEEYPITVDEVVTALNRAILEHEEREPPVIGDIQGAALARARDFFAFVQKVQSRAE